MDPAFAPPSQPSPPAQPCLSPPSQAAQKSQQPQSLQQQQQPTQLQQQQQQHQQHSAQRTLQPPVFEFTKRKKWADLLLHELTGTILFVLSPALRVLYCTPAVSELLGWQEDECTDTGLENFIHEEDLQPFVNHFNAAIASRSELSTFARLEAKTPEVKWPLFEFRGHPHFSNSPLAIGPPGSDCKCFFAMARPYPSRSTAMLDSFLELKMENERLKQRLMDARPVGSNGVVSAAPFLSTLRDTPEQLNPTATQLPPSFHQTPLHALPNMPHAHAHPYFPISSSRTGMDDGLGMGVRMGIHSVLERNGTGNGNSNGNGYDNDGDEGRRKKARRSHAGDQQYVCVSCGRTDSPEWRKGPQGPKTLCNACGLRWAKRNSMKRRAGDPNGPNTNGTAKGADDMLDGNVDGL